MSIFLDYIFFTSLLFFLNYFFLKKNLLIDKPTPHTHKKKYFFSKSVPKSIGIVLYIYVIHKFDLSLIDQFFIFIIFTLGIFSDLEKLSSPKLRFLLQLIFVSLLIFFSKSYINTAKIPLIDSLLQISFFKIIFTIICVTIIINGSNFIDGLNTLCIGYYICVLTAFLILIWISGNSISEFTIYNIQKLIFFLIILFLFNLVGSSFLGDSGSYFLGIFISILTIYLHNELPNISPWVFANFLWYPAYEILFSIIRRSISTNNPLFPDNNHFHQVFYLFLKKKFKVSINFLNPLTANIINVYNILSFFLVLTYLEYNFILMLIFIFNCIFYTSMYLIFTILLNNK
jgi:UDP-N-acetylmuramyl pentapeptide phosphotransferase/UDP-N-acetylglucosamine-1-phosphate transferase